MIVKFKNIIKALKEQGPFKRFVRNFFITGNGWGLFSKYSHYNKSNKEKVKYNTLKSALKAAESMRKKNDVHYSTYKCIFCDGYHIGRNRDNK